MKAEDGKMRLTDVADTEQLLRLIQSIPSPKAEPFKIWLAKVGGERIDETADPELAIERALETYLKKGYSKECCIMIFRPDLTEAFYYLTSQTCIIRTTHDRLCLLARGEIMRLFGIA